MIHILITGVLSLESGATVGVKNLDDRNAWLMIILALLLFQDPLPAILGGFVSVTQAFPLQLKF